MKIIATGASLTLAAALPFGAAAGPTAAPPLAEQEWNGTISAVNRQAHTVTAKNLLETRIFNLGDKCAIRAVDKRDARLGDLPAGAKVTIRYQELGGVLVADSIAEKPLSYTGTVRSVDREHGVVTMAEAPRYRPFKEAKSFRLASDCKVLLSSGGSGTLADVQPGDKISLVYELPGGEPAAYRIRNMTSDLVGTIAAMDVRSRELRAKGAWGEKTFEVAHDCRILGAGDKSEPLGAVMPGQRYRFTYEDIHGVNVLVQMAPAPAKA